METVQTTLTSHEPRSMNGNNGPWTLHKFKASDGRTYETSKQDIANAAFALAFQNGAPTNAPLVLTFETRQNGQYTNYRLSAVAAAGAGVATPSGAPTASAAPAPQSAPTQSRDDAGPRIARSVAVEHLPEYIKAGILESPSTLEQLYDVLGGLAKWIYSGSRPQGATQAPSSSGAVVGAPVAAAPAAVAEVAPPAAEPAPAQPKADDDIPF